ncbi:mandelate racemase/muconate lactonizing enzyme family protein [Streptosporangium sp. NBC_01756]|uniref:mandelate racemase/muconate lactonizing enzyme family protein n=1 Tax=Streptosporangium sp. NBC_01756 TaxID=2975950 RepID=UPI002DD8C2B7|nr:mandelate racemase/muconate lactonizing enzyme family protein [Streptosporangium sp. NBC_01756]WSC86875.1 mandelate racemase/muconate lactonizing enzyme family protein [Streptosporangium sp. NBC_01756]
MNLPIESVSVRVLSAPLRERVPMSFSALTARRSVLVTVRAGGVTGTGESWVNHPDWAWRERIATLDGLRPLLIGADAADPAALMADLAARLHGVARQWGAPGPLWQALSGVDMAVWDLLGRVHGRPVADLLADPSAGPPATRVPAYGSGVGPTGVEELTERALETGLTAVKIKVGFGEETDLATVRGVRAVAGPDLTVFADANQAWDPETARHMCTALAEHGVAWFEEPLAGDRPDDLGALAAATGVTVAGGENVYGAQAYAERLALPALAHIQPDPSKTAGISLSDQIGRMPGTARLSPHCYGGAATLAASVHLVAAAPRPGWVELDLRANPLRTDVADGLDIGADGSIPIPGGPGLGLAYHERTLDLYTQAGHG